MYQKRNDLHDDFLTLIQLETKADFTSNEVSLFDCGDDDLNGFFHDDAWDYKCQLLAETYLCYPTESYKNDSLRPIAYVSLCNDCIQVTKTQRQTELKPFYRTAIQKRLPHKKRFLHSFPAVKIARLGVQKEYCRGGIGTHLLNMIKALFLTNNRTGCRFITVDAYNQPGTVTFYKDKNKFQFLSDKDRDEDTRIMWFDLSTFTSI
jgi:GNAT superfamily N-acetyltransferase